MSGKPHREGLPAELRGVVRHARDKVVDGTIVIRLTTYKLVRADRFANALLATMVMKLSYKYLQIKAN